ncbi:CpcD phycobilisome linker protein, partial [filamentous cyanobacterium CCT1]
VQGMSQRVNPNRISYPIRSSGTTFLSVPYNRLSDQMQRINRMGGKIVSIEPLGGEPGDNHDARQQATANFQTLRHAGTNGSAPAADED